jgi:hypothetical protein
MGKETCSFVPLPDDPVEWLVSLSSDYRMSARRHLLAATEHIRIALELETERIARQKKEQV